MANRSNQHDPKAPSLQTPSIKSPQNASHSAHEQHPSEPDDGHHQQGQGCQAHKGDSAAMRAWLEEMPKQEPWYAGSRLAGRDRSQR